MYNRSVRTNNHKSSRYRRKIMKAFTTVRGTQVSEEVASKFEEARQLSAKLNSKVYIQYNGDIITGSRPFGVAAFTRLDPKANVWVIQVLG
jgi:hypothetical protein